MHSTVRRCDRLRRLPSLAAIAGVTGVLAAGVIRDDLQAHLALARVGEQSSSSTPISLPVRTTRDSAGPDCRIVAMRKCACWVGRKTDVELSRATRRRAKHLRDVVAGVAVEVVVVPGDVH